MNRDDSEKEETGRGTPCAPCRAFLEGSRSDACPPFKAYITAEEADALRMMRDIKSRARELRVILRGIDKAIAAEADAPADRGSMSRNNKASKSGLASIRRQRRQCVRELDALRRQWRKWEARVDAARHRKMVLLGHLPWEESPGGEQGAPPDRFAD